MPENFVYQPATDAQGSSRKDKSRTTWIARQGLLGLWDLPDSNTLPDGVILPSILIVCCEEPCRLKDMSLEEPAEGPHGHIASHPDLRIPHKNACIYKWIAKKNRAEAA